MKDDEANRLSARAARYLAVGTQMGGFAGGFAARLAAARLLGQSRGRASDAEALARALGGLKGPLMKAAQLIANIPEALPLEYAQAFAGLQSEAPPMGEAFVRRRMASELGPDWQKKFAAFEFRPAAAASLGQVHRARTLEGADVACKLQYPDMASAVEADLAQLDMVLALQKRVEPAIDAREAAQEIAERLREELDYVREAKHA
ncbi:MAG TPA: AarF/UbiB family protein, partial [Rhodoblastus sp.]|nr:AarF/UbiB family protein [Rhodoblastus sp.]